LKAKSCADRPGRWPSCFTSPPNSRRILGMPATPLVFLWLTVQPATPKMAPETWRSHHHRTRVDTVAPSEGPIPAPAVEAGTESPLPRVAGPAEAGLHPAGSSRSIPPTSRHAGARTGWLLQPAASASRPTLGWAYASSQLMPETAPTGLWNPALRNKKVVNTRIFKSGCLLCHTSQSQEIVVARHNS
jgi:hypothetical protein